MRDTSEKRQQENSDVRRAGLTGLVINGALVILKGAAGIISCSHALTADAVHSLSDLTTDIAVVVGSRYWGRPPDKTHPMGHRGIETTVSMFIGIMLLAAGAGIGADAVRSLGSGSSSLIPGPAAAAAAGLSAGVKWVLARWTLKKSRSSGSMALAANSVHQKTDALSSLPVLAAILLSMTGTRFHFLDPLAGTVISVFILISGVKVLKPGVMEMTNTAPPEEVVAGIRTTALCVEGVTGIHSLRARRQAGAVFVDLHVQVSGELSVSQGFLVARRVENAVRASEPSVKDVLARIEPSVPCGDADRCAVDPD